jgi:hypothetical protein
LAKSFNKTRTEYVQGKLSWAKVVKPDSMYDCWTVTIHPTPESLELIRDWQAEGMKNVLKKDEDGGYFTKFRCPTKRLRKDGTMWTFEAPKVVDADGAPMDGRVIGNGTDGTLKLEVYEHGTPGGGKAIAARLVGVRVDNLVPFNPDEDYTDEEKKEVEGLRAQPPLF